MADASSPRRRKSLVMIRTLTLKNYKEVTEIQLVLKKNLGEEKVDMKTVYPYCVDIRNFVNTKKAHLCALEFIKLMGRDGYFVSTDVVEDPPSSMQQLNINDIDFLAPFEIENPIPQLIAPGIDITGTSADPVIVDTKTASLVAQHHRQQGDGQPQVGDGTAGQGAATETREENMVDAAEGQGDSMESHDERSFFL